MGCTNVKGQASEPGKKETPAKKVNEPTPDSKYFSLFIKKKKYFSDSKQINQKFTIEQEDLIKLSEGNIYDFYDFKNRLGEGHFYLFFIKNFINFQVDMALFFFAFIIKQT